MMRSSGSPRPRVGGDVIVYNSHTWAGSDSVEALVTDPGGAFHLRDMSGDALTCAIPLDLSRV